MDLFQLACMGRPFYTEYQIAISCKQMLTSMQHLHNLSLSRNFMFLCCFKQIGNFKLEGVVASVTVNEFYYGIGSARLWIPMFVLLTTNLLYFINLSS